MATWIQMGNKNQNSIFSPGILLGIFERLNGATLITPTITPSFCAIISRIQASFLFLVHIKGNSLRHPIITNFVTVVKKIGRLYLTSGVSPLIKFFMALPNLETEMKQIKGIITFSSIVTTLLEMELKYEYAYFIIYKQIWICIFYYLQI